MNISDGGRRRFEDSEHTLRVYPGTIAEGTIYCPIPARKNSTAAEVIDSLINKLHLDKTKCYVLAEVKEFGGEEWILNPTDCPVQRMMLWPRMALENRLSGEDYRFLLREKNLDGSIHYGSLQSWLRVTEERRRMQERGFLPQPPQKDFDDLCSLPDLNEKTLLENLRSRFKHEKIYTYVGSILIVINPFKFLPIYNPKYVKMYDNHQLGKLEPHIYAVADVAYHAMLQRKKNQCIVISGESGSGKTQSTNFLIHHLTALSQKGFASGVEQIILGAGPVLEAFGNAKTAHNNNSSRFGKFIQVNYQETGTVLGAYVEKYLLEKSRLVYQEHNERNYHVFYYLLAGASEEERLAFHLKQPEEYYYLNQITKKPLRQNWDDYCYDSEPQDCFTVEGEDLRHDFERLQLAMEMVGFLPKTRRQIFSLLSAILHLGNICYKKKTYRDDSIDICNPEVLPVVSELLEVKEEMLFEALVTRKTVTVGEKLVLPYKLAEAVTVRNSMAKSLYSALFDWIVFRINHALLNGKDLEHNTKTLSIGVLDIFGFEDYENNSFEQFCINFANERLQHYFNQHIFKLEQEEYRAEGISWRNIDYTDNTCCLSLISRKPTGLLHLLDEESNFPQATNQTLLDKFKHQHEDNSYIEFPAVMEPAFIIKHYAGKVKYGVKDFREKNTDHMRPDIVVLLRSSKNAFISGMIGIDPVAVFRWAVLRAFFRAMVAFREAGKRHIQKKTGHDDTAPCAILKSMDSFSFLQHPVHQRSLEILQRCKEEKYSITRKNPRTPLSDLQGMNTLNEKNQHDSFDITWNVRPGIRQSRLPSGTSLLDKDGIFANSASSKLLERAHGILTRNKNFKSKPVLPKHLLEVNSLKHLTRLTLQDRITKSLLHLHKKKKPPSISAQFQASLSKLMETLGQAEPYFVKCIRSNAEKLPLRFNDALVLRQLRYTGMLETVRIRQSGYSSKYSFQDFVNHFHVLLPRNTIASKFNIQDFFRKISLNPDSYQVGKTMVFLKEKERQYLQDLLHQEVLRRIIVLQRWFRVLLCRQHFLHLRQASIIIQRFWRSYLHLKQVRDAVVQKDAFVMASAAALLQASWRAHLERQRYLELRSSAIIIQQRWRELCRRRHMAATCIQARWRGYRESKRYKAQRNKIILLQSACRGFRARQRFKALKELKLKETKLEHGLVNTKTCGALEIQGSDPAEWEDCSFDDRVKAVEEYKSVIESNRISRESSGDFSKESPVKHQETGRSQSGVDLQEDVIVRERPKSLEDLHQKKVGRAKRESRRMRELEQAIFSLELLKVRSLGGASPSEERRWSTELMSEGLQSPQGTPDSESSQGSLELLNCEESQKSKLESIILDEGDLQVPSPKISSCPNSDAQDTVLGASSEASCALTPKGATSDSEHLKSGTVKEKPVCSSEPMSCKPQLRESFISNSLPTFFYIPHQDPLKTSSKIDTNIQRNKLLESEDTPRTGLTWDTNKEAKKYHFSGDHLTPLNIDSSSTVLKKLEKLNTEKEKRQKQLQQQNEKEMMQQIRQQTDILEKERKAFKTVEHSGTGESLLAPSFCQSKERVERPSSLLILNTTNKAEPSVLGSLSLVTKKDAALAPEDSPSAHLPMKDRPVTTFFERKASPCQSSTVKELSKTERMSTQQSAACKLSNNHISKREHLRPAQSYCHKSTDSSREGSTRAIFFTPRDNMNSPLVNKESLNGGNPQVGKQDGPSWKPKLAGLGQQEQVARPAHKKKARMARTRSDFLTRGTFADGEGDTEDDDYDGITEPLLSLDRASHSELGPASSLGQASHSDSEMTSQRFSSIDEQTKLHKTMSQGEITKLAVRQKASDSDIRPQRAKMRFWAKGKHGEKKTTRVKPVTQSEASAFFADSDVTPSHQGPEELSQHHPTPPLSPELPSSCRKEFKENKEPSPKAKRTRSVKISNVAMDSVRRQNDSIQIIASASDLKSMDEFLLKKMNDLDNEDSKKDTLVDVVFKKALKEFRQNIFSFYSSALAMDDGKSIRYKDLYALFEQILEKTMRLEQRDWSESPVRVWVNTFKVFLDEYMNEFKTSESTTTKAPKTERKKRRKKETDLVEEHNGHIFKATQYSIPTYCEYCSSLIWIMDRASVCKLCKYACHKKCCLKTTAMCSKKCDPELSSRQFGVELSRLTSEDRTVPLVVEKLINYIEMHGLYTEGIYRKSGSTNKIKELRQGLDTDAESVNLDDYNIHVIASVFKQWLRDLPNPLMTFELYEEFLRAMGLQERKETIRGVYSVIDQLSRTHLNTLERLIFHLVRIALQEDTNRMSANALAIVFAPCILRCPDTTDPLQSVQDISKTTICVELIVVEQMSKYKARLKDISSLEFAENKAKTRLSLIRRSMGKGRIRRGNYPSPSSPVIVRLPSVSDVPEETLTSEAAMETDITEQQQAAMQREERVLTEQIESLQKEKEELTFEMLVLEPRASDDETLESEASIGTADSSENLNMESEGAVSERSERSLALCSLKIAGKSEPSSKLRKQLRKQQDSVDSVDSTVSSSLSNTTSSHGTRKRFQIYSKSPFYRVASASEAAGVEGPLGQTRSLEDKPQFISRGTFNPEKGKQKLKNVKNSPQKTKETPEGTVMSGRKKAVEPDCSSTPQLALFGNNEFMV
ncbi:unconventional myosin-IXa isoform X5 [Castor canadensis]|uniref:Unconventional myosin-IXa isoform X5 n=1 Tax=Castor canadensis TaxID=51338 RepID=A0AC58LKY5_CASCN